MQNCGDTLSGESFAFLFPIIKAALFGPRTSVGCEGALKLLYQYTVMLCGEMLDANVVSIRKEMVVAVLELLKHDRSQTFQNPTPMEALSTCYSTDMENPSNSPVFTVAELAPLLDDRGALGSKNCRLGAMFALTCIAENHAKMLKTNLLVENRIWLNCFDRDNDVRTQGRKAWAKMNGVDYDSLVADESTMPRPSPLYAPPLLSLLSHTDSSIALAAADAYARAMSMHVNSINRNISILCTTYIDNFPIPTTVISTASASKSTTSAPVSKSKPLSSIAPVPKKVITGLPKAKAPPKSALAIAGIGQPKTVVKKKSISTAALLKPKQERTLDQATLDSQFKMNTPVEVEKEKDSAEKVAVRKGVLRAVSAFSTSSLKVSIDEESLKLLTSFLIAYGIADSDDGVQGAARDTLRDVVASNGGSEEAISFLLPLLEGVLKTGAADESTLGALPKEKVPKNVVASDRRKEGTVVALGSVALHLQGPENDAKVDSSVDMLIDALKTPSEEVQNSVAEALAKLMKKGQTQDRVEVLLSNLLRDCLHGDSLAVRRGAAYGLAAAVKGSGITTLKKYEIVKQLEEACSNGNTNSKEGSLFAIELLTSRLGLLFEPYVIVLLPSLLQAFSDNSDHVRNAASHTAGLIMSKLSAHGVKLVMPAVLSAFNDPAWRTKQASILMLGAMSHLAPKQLASALPKVVPKLTEAFSDTHAKVKASAQEALNEISTVVKNPEIASICPTLLKALTDPADNTARALEALIATEFLHAIDSPSLALIAPILHRGLRDRGATTKRASSLITGNICSMINDPKDFVPYLPTLLPDLQASLLDPIPDVRSTSAQALGSLTRSLGEVILLELRPWLIERLRDERCSSAERSGAAQGLTEVLIAAGSAMVEGTMRTEIIPLRSHPSASTREGVLWMLTFLPPSMGQGFTPLIDVSLPALIGGLSDDSETVRDVALRAGRVLIRSHGKVHVDKILPSLEAGLNSDDHRIRIASLSLLGDLLSLIGGTQLAKGESDTQDDLRKAERAQAQIALVLGAESRKRVLSGLYMARSDSVHMVRQSAIQVWKTVVSVTARALRDILPVLVARIIDDLASGHYERTEIAGRCLGDIVGKLGDSVLPQIIPVLRKALYDGDDNTKRGVCVGLTEVIQCSNKEQILRFLEIIIPVVRDALSADSEIVRKMAAISFQSLYAAVGSRVMDEIVPTFMVALETGEHDEVSRMRALNGLTGILGVRSRELLPYIIPRLIKRPITTNQAEVLAGIARVTGSTIHFHFAAIIPALVYELADVDGKDETKEQALRLCSRSICGSVDTVGVNWLFSEIVAKCGSDKASLRRESCRLLDCAIIEREYFFTVISVSCMCTPCPI
jgi:HEAT repeat protein